MGEIAALDRRNAELERRWEKILAMIDNHRGVALQVKTKSDQSDNELMLLTRTG